MKIRQVGFLLLATVAAVVSCWADEVLPQHWYLALNDRQTGIAKSGDEAAAQKEREWALAVSSVDIPVAWPSSTNDIYVTDVYWSSYCLVRELDPKAVFTVPATLCSNPKLSWSAWERMPIHSVIVRCTSGDREAPPAKWFLDRGFRVRLDGKDIPVKTTPSLGAEIALELTPTAENPRNSEGDFVWLRDGTLLFAWSRFYQAGKHENGSWDNGGADIACRRSSDDGRTWSGKDEILVRNTAMNLMSVSFLRLADGRIALFYIEKESAAVYKAMMRTSADEAKTWSDAVEITACLPLGMYVLNNARVVQLKSGRILAPLAYHPPKPEGGNRSAAKLFCVRSDDGGRTWAAGAMSEVFDAAGERVVSQEPGVIELKDGRVMMWTRTNGGAQYAGYSSDGGVTWSAFKPTDLKGPLSPATIKRLKTGELIAVWNDHRGHPERGRIRAPLSIALSRDEGRTWSASVTLEENLTDFLCYTALVETDDDLLLAYCTKRERNLDTLRLTRLPQTALPSAKAGAGTVIGGDCTIVAPAPEPSGVSRALEDLARNIRDVVEESVGLKLAVTTSDKFAGGRAVWLGAAAAEKAGLMPADLKGFENVYAEKDGDVYLFGHDVSGTPNVKDVGWHVCLLPTVKAATRFMEDVMNVRFLAPGKVGRDVPRLEKVGVASGTFSRHRPDQVYAPSRLDEMLYSYAANQFGCAGFHTYGGHTYPKACPPSKYFKDHPEYFGLVNGRRVGHNEKNPTLCISNPAVEDLIVNELLARYDEGATVCQLGQQDGSQFCECENCRNYGGVKDDIGEQLWIFHRRIAERIEKLRPGKLVQIISYGKTSAPPKTFRKFPSNVMIETCRATDAAFDLWKDHDVPHGFTAYVYLWGNYPFLGTMAKHSYVYLADFVRLLQRHGVHGIYRCGYGEFYGTEGPGYYLFNTLLDKPEADINALLDEYCARAYGPAAAMMRAFHDALDVRLRGTDRVADETLVHGGAHLLLGPMRESWPQTALDLHAYIFVPDVVAKLDGLLACAEKTPNLTEKQRIRLGLVRKEYDYARMMGRIAVLYAAYRTAPTQAAFDVLATEIERRNALVDAYTGGGDTAIRLPEWPEIRFFGGFPRKVLETNGRLWAEIGSPLSWDVKAMREKGILPGTNPKTAKVPLVAGEPPFDDFASGAWADIAWQDLSGTGTVASRTARFKVLAGPDALFVAVESGLPVKAKVLPCKRDSPLTRVRENLALSVATFDPHACYWRFVWNPNEGSCADGAFGLVRDTLDPKYNSVDWDWDGDWSFRTERSKAVWRTVARIPYAALGTTRPNPGDRWAFNLSRVFNLGTERKRDLAELVWNPSFTTARKPDACVADAMGVLEFARTE